MDGTEAKRALWFKVFEDLGRLHDLAKEEDERTHRASQLLAERIAAYYGELRRRDLPQDLVQTLVVAYHQRQLAGVMPLHYVPVPLSEEKLKAGIE